MRTCLRRPGRALVALTVAATAVAIGCVRDAERDLAAARTTGNPPQAAPARRLGPGYARKPVQVWTTSCESGAGETAAALFAIARAHDAIRSVGLACQVLRADGGLATTGDDRRGLGRGALAADLARRGVATALVVSNAGANGFDGALAARVLGAPALRERLLLELVSVQAIERHAAVELDFEAMPTSAAAEFTAFVAALHARLPRGVEVVVDVHAKTVDDPGWPGPGAHDYGALARAGAIVRAMTYDYSVGPVPAGPTTKASWIRRVVAYARAAGVPREQLEIGLPAYGYDFPPRDDVRADARAIALRWSEAVALQVRTGAELLRDDDGAPHFAYDAADGRHEVWFDDAASITRLLDELRDVSGDLGGLAIWGAYGADPGVFDAIARARP